MRVPYDVCLLWTRKMTGKSKATFFQSNLRTPKKVLLLLLLRFLSFFLSFFSQSPLNHLSRKKKKTKRMAFGWESESYPEAKDLAVLPFFAFFFYAARLFLDSFIFERLARRLILGQNHDGIPPDQRKTIIKFKESAWKCIYYLSADIFAVSVSYNEPWFTNTKYFWEGPGDQFWPNLKMKLELKGLYMYVSGFYIYALFALVFWETRRSDFFVSMTHHVATLILLGMSFLLRFCRVGAIILALHDASDVFLEIGKMSLYSGYEKLATVFFPLFVLSFTVLRIIYFPFWILRSTSYEVLVCFSTDTGIAYGMVYYYAFNTLLFCLMIINLYWWRLMCRMLVSQIQQRGEVKDDVRSDSEEEDDHED